MSFVSILFMAICLFADSHSTLIQVHKCKLDDAMCLVEAFQLAVPTFMSGIPEASVEVLDVMDVDDVEFKIAGLQLAIKQLHLKGLKSIIIDKVIWDETRKTILIEFHGDYSGAGYYSGKGKMMNIPFNGSGDFKMKLRNFVVILNIDYILEKDDQGKNHVVIKEYDLEFEARDGARYTFTKLFEGNENLSASIHTVMNDNWKLVTQIFGRPLTATVTKKIMKSVSSYLKYTPIDDIILT